MLSIQIQSNLIHLVRNSIKPLYSYDSRRNIIFNFDISDVDYYGCSQEPAIFRTLSGI